MKDRRLHGRRKGKPLRAHHARLIEELLPKLRIGLAAPVADSGRETWLEIGFGGGEHLAHQAALRPETDFLGAEFFVNGIAKLLARIEAKGLANIRIHDGDGRELLAALPEACLARVFLLYPDPWPKARHRRRRFVDDENLSAIRRALAPHGLFVVSTDIAAYARWTLAQVRAHGGFVWTAESPRDWREAPEGWTETRYETKAKAAERTPLYLIFRRSADVSIFAEAPRGVPES